MSTLRVAVDLMIFQAWVAAACDGRAAEAVKRIEAVSGMRLGYQRVYRWCRAPVALPLDIARAVAKASEGKCTLDELMKLELIVERFSFIDTDAPVERKFLAQRIAERERELKQLEALLKPGQTIDERRDELKQLRSRLSRISVSKARARKPGRPRTREVAKRRPRAAA